MLFELANRIEETVDDDRAECRPSHLAVLKDIALCNQELYRRRISLFLAELEYLQRMGAPSMMKGPHRKEMLSSSSTAHNMGKSH